MAKQVKTTTRSYTLGLLTPSDFPDWSPLWDRLFRTHYATCRGAREYGEFFLNLRGGLPASLAGCLDEQDEDRRRLLQRGARRMLVLGWFSVESVRGAENHPHRVREVGPGQSLAKGLAEELLRSTLRTHKGVSREADVTEWVSDCSLALTANIRHDAVIVNRAAAFAEWQRSFEKTGAEMPEQARRILFAMCGDGFSTLTLPEEAVVTVDDNEAGAETSDLENEDTAAWQTGADEAAEPSNASRRVFGDLFGGDASKKLSRAEGKERFAIGVRRMLTDLGSTPPTRETITEFRKLQNLPELDTSRPEKYPGEVCSSGAPTAVAKRYRKLLVCLKLWPASAGENGVPRTSAVSSYGKRVAVPDEPSRNARINALDLIDACPATTENGDESDAGSASNRVLTPPWAIALAERVAAATNMPMDAKSLNEFKRLMFALAARRISQTQSWTKRNEAERHKAAVKEDAAKRKLQELDSTESGRAWLRKYEDGRADRSEAIAGFRVTRRMIGECDAVFNAWKSVATEDERAKRTTTVQAGAEKFGDPAFYADLSADPEAASIWQCPEGAEILKQWVKVRQAQYDQQRLKIPRFCHPDPFHHPTWCEFGGSSKPKVWYAWRPETKPRHPEAGGDADGSRRLWMLLPDFTAQQATAVPMRWRNKRLSKDLGGVRDVVEKAIPRADRASKAAADLPLKDAKNRPIRYRPEHPFTENAKGWNARLQISRDALEHLEGQWDDERGVWRDAGRALRNARWFVTFAPALAASEGPGRSIHPKLGWKSEPNAELNKTQKRQGHAKLILSRLPGLRVLSVDLGHRFAAACAVWETLSAEQMKAACQNAGHAPPAESDLYLHLTATEKDGKTRTRIYRRIGADKLPDGKEHPAPWARLDRQFLIKVQGEERPPRAASNKGDVNETQLVARFADRLGLTSDDDRTDGRAVDELMSRAVRIATLGLMQHARRAKIAYALDPKTTTIPGMGGSEKAFQPGDDAHVEFLTRALFDWHSLASESKCDDKPARELWNQHVATMANEWRVPDPQPPDEATEGPTRQQRRKDDDALRQRLKPLAERLAAADRTGIHEAWKVRWKKDDGQEAVVPAVLKDQKGPAKTSVSSPANGWHAELRWLTDWIMGKRLRGATGTSWKQNVGGLSVTRIATMKSLYQLHKAFAMRARPDKPRGAPEKGETNAGIAQSILNAMERMREQRVKQLASRIAASALGLGGHWKQIEMPRRGDNGEPPRNNDGPPAAKTKWVWVEEQDRKYAPCHAVVIENLTNYRPEETRTRRENRQLMAWSSSKVKKYLAEACQLHGLHLREVQAGYTSRQDSRTGAPGIRCQDVPVADFVRPGGYLWKRVLKAAKEVEEKGEKASAENRLFAGLHRRWDEKGKTWTDAGNVKWTFGPGGKLARNNGAALDRNKGEAPAPVRVPQRGGELFVSAQPCACDACRHTDRKGLPALQADLNAAANIGLRALLDPDFPGRWWYVPCDPNSGIPVADKVKGSILDNVGPLFSPTPAAGTDEAGKRERGGKRPARQREVVYRWRDPQTSAIRGREGGETWEETTVYWNQAQWRAIEILRTQVEP